MKPFPWHEAMGFGLGVLRLAPDQFWRMTPRGVVALLRARAEDNAQAAAAKNAPAGTGKPVKLARIPR